MWKELLQKSSFEARWTSPKDLRKSSESICRFPLMRLHTTQRNDHATGQCKTCLRACWNKDITQGPLGNICHHVWCAHKHRRMHNVVKHMGDMIKVRRSGNSDIETCFGAQNPDTLWSREYIDGTRPEEWQSLQKRSRAST